MISDVDRVHNTDQRVLGCVPAPELDPALPRSGESAVVRQMHTQRQHIPGRQGSLIGEQLPQIYPVVGEEIRNKRLAVLVYEAGEDSASPNCDSETQRPSTAVYKLALIVGSSSSRSARSRFKEPLTIRR